MSNKKYTNIRCVGYTCSNNMNRLKIKFNSPFIFNPSNRQVHFILHYISFLSTVHFFIPIVNMKYYLLRKPFFFIITLIILILVFYFSTIGFLKSYTFKDCLQFQQTDTRLVNYLRRNVFVPPSELPYNFTSEDRMYLGLPELVSKLLPILKKKVNGLKVWWIISVDCFCSLCLCIREIS